MNAKLEVIGFTIEGCVLAEEAGAHRIELCDNPGEGGTTASYGFIKAAREKFYNSDFVKEIIENANNFQTNNEHLFHRQ